MRINTNYLTVLLAFVLWIAAAASVSAENAGDRYASTSCLASGKWIKIRVTDNAVYKLTYEDIKKMGISDPAKVRICGYGGWMIDEDFTKTYIDDLPEVPVWMNKGSDGVFGAGDYLLFYGRGSVKWKGSDHENNPYSSYGYYFLTEGENAPKEMGKQTSLASADLIFTTFDDYYLHEKDSVTIANTGRELYGESFVGKKQRDFTFSVPGRAGRSGMVYVSFAAAPAHSTPLYVSVNGKETMTSYVSVPSSTYEKACKVERAASWTEAQDDTESVKVSLSFDIGMQTIANLNYVKIGVSRHLRPYASYTFFRNSVRASASQRSARYDISNASSNCMVWNVSDCNDPRLIETTLSETTLSFAAELPASTADLPEYALIDLSKNFPTPTLVGIVANQDLHALPETDMVIISPKSFLIQAETLAAKHRESGLKVSVVLADQIYNEFSSGAPDASAYRRFMKMFYDRATTEDEKPKYLLLFGDGMFDNRFRTMATAKLNPDNYLLTYQVKESLNETISYGTDDYFGLLGNNARIGNNSDLDLGIGRLPVSTMAQADNAVNKIIGYMENKKLGNWKNKMIFAADNTDSDTPGESSFCVHAGQADDLARYMEKEHPEYLVTRSYMDAFRAVSVNGKNTFPEAKKRLLETMKAGVFMVNYTGHGSTTAWSQEDMLNITDVRQMSFETLPLWITATCDFGWFDGLSVSAGEEAFLNKKSGAIALFTTSRVVYSGENYRINEQLVKHLFTKQDGKYLRLGDVLRLSKNKLNHNNKLNYVLLGDPALCLNYPEYHVHLEQVNGEDVADDSRFQFKALENVTLKGRVVDENNQPVQSFDGTLELTVLDSRQEVKSISTDSEGGRFSFTEYPNRIYTGSAEVSGGVFSISFTVPLDISYGSDNGKLNMYAYDPSRGLEAGGSYERFVLNGTGGDIDSNTEGPMIKSMYLNTTSFQNGDQVNPTPFFVAYVYDEDGINISGGLGHDIMISIDNNPLYTHVLNKYYVPVTDYEGEIRFSIPSLPVGRHKLIFRVWDILNNPRVDSLDFEVVAGLKPQLYDITALGNPAKVNTYFQLEHDRPNSQIEVEIGVYDLSGRVFWKHTEKGYSDWLKNYQIEWDLTTTDGRRVPPGVYIYRASIREGNSREATKAKKLIVLGQ